MQEPQQEHGSIGNTSYKTSPHSNQTPAITPIKFHELSVDDNGVWKHFELGKTLWPYLEQTWASQRKRNEKTTPALKLTMPSIKEVEKDMEDASMSVLENAGSTMAEYYHMGQALDRPCAKQRAAAKRTTEKVFEYLTSHIEEARAEVVSTPEYQTTKQALQVVSQVVILLLVIFTLYSLISTYSGFKIDEVFFYSLAGRGSSTTYGGREANIDHSEVWFAGRFGEGQQRDWQDD